MTAEEVPVLVAGAGPVGTTLAMDLARLGVASIVLERRRGIPPNPKCNTTNARSMELFRRLGCADAIRDSGLPADHTTDVVFMTRLTGVELARFERSTPADVRAGTQHGVAVRLADPRAAALRVADLPRARPARHRHRSVGGRPARGLGADRVRAGRRRRHRHDS